MNELAKRIISYILIITCIITTIPYMDNSIQVNALAGFSGSMHASSAVGSATPQATTIKNSVIQHTQQFLSSESDEVRYRASLLIEVLSVTSVFDNEVVEIQKQDNIQQEIEEMNSARKNMTSMNEKSESTPDVTDVEINISSSIEADENETPKEETPKEEPPKEETPDKKEKPATLSSSPNKPITLSSTPISDPFSYFFKNFNL